MKRFIPPDADVLRVAYADLQSIEKVAVRFGVSASTAYKWLRQIGCVLRSPINWKGGRVVHTNGYILIHAPDHPRAWRRGYVYEHILVAEQKIGRSLIAGEEVHHKNGNKQDNEPDNLEVVRSRAEHCFVHRIRNSRLRAPGEENEWISCACGCGLLLLGYDGEGRPRKRISGHWRGRAPHAKKETEIS